MKVVETSLPGVLVVEPAVFGDSRGFFMESFQARRYREAGITCALVQDNLSFSRRDVLRGLHLQNPSAQDKLVYVLAGEVFDVAVDVRLGSPTFGQWVGEILSHENKRQLFVPRGFAHGFCVTSETALFAYKCSDYYDPAGEVTILWDDPRIGIEWPTAAPSLSAKDSQGSRLDELHPDLLPKYSVAA